MYQPPPPPREPSGCIETLVISRMILQILFIPLMLILGTIIGVLLALYAFSTHPILALIVVVVLGLIIAGVARWEWVRVGKEMQENDENR